MSHTVTNRGTSNENCSIIDQNTECVYGLLSESDTLSRHIFRAEIALCHDESIKISDHCDPDFPGNVGRDS